MSWLKTITREIFGLFVDDDSFAVATVLWLVFLWLVFPRLGAAGAWQPATLFVGLVVILIESVLRRARRK